MNSNFPSDPTSFAVDYGSPQAQHASRIDIVNILRQNALLIVAVFIVVSVPLCTAIWFLVPLEYKVTAELLFSAAAPRILDEDDGKKPTVNYEKWLTTQLAFIEGPTILKRVADDRAVRQIGEVRQATDAYEFILSKVRADSSRNSELVKISARLQNGEDAKIIVDSVIKQYLLFSRNFEASQDSEILDLLNQEKTTIQLELSSKLESINQFQRDLGIPLVDIPQQGPIQTVSARQALTKAREDLSGCNSKLEEIEDQFETLAELQERHRKKPTEKLFALGIETSVTADSRVSNIRNEQVTKETSLRILQDSFTENHQRRQVAEESYKSLVKQVAEVEIHVRKEILDESEAKLQVEQDGWKKSQEDAEARRDQFQAELEVWEERQSKNAVTIAALGEAKLKAEEHRSRLRTIRDQINSLQLERKAPARVTRASDAIVPSAPSATRRAQMMFIVLMGAGAAGLGLALLRELTNKHVRTVQDLGRITPLPVLASIPDTKAAGLPKEQRAEMLMAEHPQSLAADEYRRILTRIVYPPDDTVEVNSCLIASPTRGDGKTTLACNLAAALAQANRRVLLIDVCARRPRIEECFGLEPGPGLAEILYDSSSYLSVVRPTQLLNLHVLGPGFDAHDLQGKLAAREMMQFLEQVEKDYDHVVIDTPPSLLMSDAKLLAPIMDGVVVTVGVGKSTLGMVRRALTELEHANGNVIGLVLNGIKPTRGGYMAKNLKLYDGYTNGRTLGAIDGIDDLPEMTITDDDDESSSAEPAVVLLSDDSDIRPVDRDDVDRDD